MNKILMDKKVIIAKEDIDLSLEDNSNIEIDIFNTSLSVKKIKINVLNNTSLLINYASVIKNDSTLDIEVIVLGNNNIINIRNRCIAKSGFGKITCNIKAMQNTKDNILVEDLKGINENGEILFMPILEIDSNEVEASHFATIGFLDKDELFYLQNKGISYNSACELLKKKFIFNIFNEKIKEEFEKEGVYE